MRVSFLALAYCMVMKALWLVVVLVKQPSLGVGVIVYGRVREREHTRRGDVWLVVGCLSASAGLDGVLCVCVQFTSVWSYLR